MLWLVLSALACLFIYVKVIKPLSYWKDRGIPYQKPWPLFGNMGPTVCRLKPFSKLLQDFYNAFPDKRYNGIHQFTSPVLIVRDLDLIKQITIKDFDHFTDHNAFVSEDVDPLMGRNLSFLKGQRWRDMRATLSPSFTSSKMRTMFVFLSECAEQFTQYFQKQESVTIVLEMKDMFNRFTNDAIASIAFGLKVDSLKERDNEFYRMGKAVSTFSGLRAIKFFIFNMSPTLTKILNVKFLPDAVDTFFRRIVKENIQQREQEGLVRLDMIHLLMEARKGRPRPDHANDLHAGFTAIEESPEGKVDQHQKLELSDDDITAQAVVFFLGGFESIAATISFLVYELAVNPEAQQKLQTEIDATLQASKGKITYEALLGMKYLDMVVSETLRKWPPGFQIDRVCVKDYTINPNNPDEKAFTVEKGQLIIIPVYGIHRDPWLFPNPDHFDPERFSEENKHNIQPSSYMPFGSGPRSCIASRLALLETKTLCFHLLSKFDIVVVEKTPIPIKLSTKSLNMLPDGGFWLGLKQRKTGKKLES